MLRLVFVLCLLLSVDCYAETVFKATEVKLTTVTTSIDPVTATIVDKPTIIMVTNDTCPHCDKWWAKHAESLRSVGWNVVKKSRNDLPLYPTFRIYHKKTWVTSEGYMEMNDLRQKIGLPAVAKVVKAATKIITAPVKVIQAVQSARYSSQELQSMIRQRNPGRWRLMYADVAPRSQAKQHLVTTHGFTWEQVSSLSPEEALILHDQAHGGKIKPSRTMQSGCANGECYR